MRKTWLLKPQQPYQVSSFPVPYNYPLYPYHALLDHRLAMKVYHDSGTSDGQAFYGHPANISGKFPREV